MAYSIFGLAQYFLSNSRFSEASRVYKCIFTKYFFTSLTHCVDGMPCLASSLTVFSCLFEEKQSRRWRKRAACFACYALRPQYQNDENDYHTFDCVIALERKFKRPLEQYEEEDHPHHDYYSRLQLKLNSGIFFLGKTIQKDSISKGSFLTLAKRRRKL